MNKSYPQFKPTVLYFLNICLFYARNFYGFSTKFQIIKKQFFGIQSGVKNQKITLSSRYT